MPLVYRYLTYLTMLCSVVLAGCTADRSSNFSVGDIMTPGNTQIPLPPGHWQLLASDNTTSGTTLGGGINNQHSTRVYYANIENGRISQLVFVNTSEGAPSAYGYGTGGDCLRSPPSDFVYFADPRGGSINAIDCVKVTGNRLFNSPSRMSSDLYRKAYQSAQIFGGMPRFSVQVEIAEAHSLRYQDYYLYSFPEQSAAQTRSADWRIDDMKPANRQFVDGLIGWAKGFREAVRLGTEYRL